MSLTNLEIFNFINSCKEMVMKNLPLKLAYCLRYNMNILTPYYQACEEERMKLIKKYAIKDENGSPVVTDGELTFANDSIYIELNELLSIQNEIEVRKIDIDIVERTEEEQFDNITTEELNNIMFMIEG